MISLQDVVLGVIVSCVPSLLTMTWLMWTDRIVSEEI
jgi:hypothetical protein